MPIIIVEHTPTYMLFEVVTKYDFVSELRDILLYQTPGVRFTFVSIHENTTIFHDELLPIRFNRIPIYVDDPSTISLPINGEYTAENTLTYDLDVKAVEAGNIMSSSIVPRKVYPGINVEQDIPIVPVKRGQELKVTLFAQKGFGTNFSPVYLVNTRRKMEIISPVSKEARDSCKYGVFDIEDFPVDIIPSPNQYDIYKCIKCGECTSRGVVMKTSSMIMEMRTSGIDPLNALKLAVSELRSRGMDIEAS